MNLKSILVSNFALKWVNLYRYIKEANRAARLCVCEAQTGTAEAISRCLDCGHTACSKCRGRPEHNFDGGIVAAKNRILPGEFSFKLKRALPMRVKLSGLDVDAALKQARSLAGKEARLMGAASVADDYQAETWKQWRRAMQSVADAEFLFRDVPQ